jgi:DNA adenine methylase
LLAPWIITHFPAHDVYVEPYGGGGSVLMRKPRSYAEVWNDMDGDVMNLFQVLRGPDADRLVQLMRFTPFARDGFEEAYRPTTDPVEKARRLLIRAFQGFGSNGHARKTGFRANSNRSGTTPAHDWVNLPDNMVAVIGRLQGVVIENRDAKRVMTAHDGEDTLHYVDPPYVMATRSDDGDDYAHEMTDADHSELLAFLQSLKGMVVLSGYAHPLYDMALAGWRREEREALSDCAKKRTEVLWINPLAAGRLSVEGKASKQTALL